MGKIDDIVGDLSDFASDFFSRSQVQLDSFSGIALKDAEYGRIRLDDFSCANKLEQVSAATMMIRRRSEWRFISTPSGSFQSDLRANNDPTNALPGGFGTGRIH
jgi:hypothetical protein